MMDTVPRPHDFQPDIDAVGRIKAVPMILDVICRTTGMGFAAVARVTEDRWIICEVRDSIDFGLAPGGELAVRTTICNDIRQSGEAVVIDDTSTDEIYCGHPTPARYGFRSYISMPIIRADGSFFGTLCAIDPRPARLKNPETVGMFRLFAQLIATQLDADERLAAAEIRLGHERHMAELRDQFIAVLGHDLRNPVAALGAGTKLLLDTPLNERATGIVNLMQASVHRMGGLIDNLLDFAQGRLGGGISVDRDDAGPLDTVLMHIIDELRTIYPDRIIETHFDFRELVACDRQRIGQLFSNLLGNALSHGKPDRPVRIISSARNGVFEISVANAGEAIPEAELASLFLPFSRGKTRPSQMGLGLGLYIASEIAKGHGGALTVASTAKETRFTFRMPLS